MTRDRRAPRLALGAVLVLALTGPAPSAQEPDRRQVVALPPAGQERVLGEMRAMLESVDAIVRALGTDDLAAAERAARAAGMGAAVDMDPAMQQRLPPAFLALGMQTHRAFDRLADELKAGPTTAEALRGLAGVTANCVACHAAWRFPPPAPSR